MADTKKQQKQADELLGKVVKDVKDSIDYVRVGYWPKWERHWKLWNNERVKVQYHGVSDSFEPMVFQLTETLVAHIYGGKPKPTFMPTRREQAEETKILNTLMDAWWDANDMSRKVIPFGRETKIIGNAALFIGWEKDRPKIIHVPMRDCILDYSTPDPNNARFAGYRRMEMLADLKKELRYDPKGKDEKTGKETGAWVSKYKNLDMVETWTAGADERLDKSLKDTYRGSILSDIDKKAQCEIVKMFYLDKTIEVANRSVIIYEEDTIYRKDAYTAQVEVPMMDDDNQPISDQESGEPRMVMQSVEVPEMKAFLPYCLDRDFVDNSILLARSSVEAIANLQEELNDTRNQDNDNRSKIVDRVVYLDPNSQADLGEVSQRTAGAVLPVRKEEIQWEPVMDISQAGERKALELRQAMRDTVGADEVISGSKPDNQATATQINAQTAGAGQRFGVSIQNLENGTYKRLYEILFKFVQIFVTEEQVVRVVGKDGVEFKDFNPNHYWGPYDVRVELDTTAKAEQQAKATQAIQMYELMQNSPVVDPSEALKWVLKTAFDKDSDEIEPLLLKQQEQPQMGPDGQPMPPDPNAPQGAMPMGMPGQPQPAGAPPPPTTEAPSGQVHESADLVKLYVAAVNDPSLQDQIVGALGFEPTSDHLPSQKLHLEKAKAIHDSQLALEKHHLTIAQALKADQVANEAPPEVQQPVGASASAR